MREILLLWYLFRVVDLEVGIFVARSSAGRHGCGVSGFVSSPAIA